MSDLERRIALLYPHAVRTAPIHRRSDVRDWCSENATGGYDVGISFMGEALRTVVRFENKEDSFLAAMKFS